MADVDLGALAHQLGACCEDARIDPASVAIFVVDAVRAPGTTPLAYLQPASRLLSDTVLVFRAVGTVRVDALRLSAHRLAIWRALPGVPAAALGPMLRHELEHARRFELSGPSFYEADGWLRSAVSRAGGGGYARLPSEREANAAASGYAARTLSARERQAVADCEDCAALLTVEPAPVDVVADTFAELARLADAGVLFTGPATDTRQLARLRASCAVWPGGERLDLVAGRTAPRIELVSPFAMS